MEHVQNEQQVVESTNKRPQRVKRKPIWMENFVIEGDDAQLIHADFDGENEDNWQQPMEQVQNEQQVVESTNERPQRVKMRLVWMENFVIEGIDEDQHTNFALFFHIVIL
ncbi:hypothetical protein V6N12_028448 [Hibiscus sabdariffa]|uniref:Uncharacterized protein n=1 Tax=Hibiscus sabdariffa TaxID=183260 RepID=A0ABR2F5V5_9ROSI